MSTVTRTESASPHASVLFDETFALDVFDEALWAPRRELAADWSPSAGLYLFFYLGTLSAYAPLTARDLRGAWPIYVGSTKNLRDRMRRHTRTLESTSNVGTGDLAVVALEYRSVAHARHAEQALLETLGTVLWNQTWLAGFGSRPQGARRHGATSPWRLLHPTTTTTPDAHARQRT